MEQRKVLKKSLIGISVVGFLVLTAFVISDTSLDQLDDATPPKSVVGRSTGEIKIGVIGDSWVTGNKLDRAIEESLESSGLKTHVVSSGHPGAKSRQVYRNLFLEEGADHSSKALFVDEDLDYLVAVAGVNDSVGHIGKSFYAHHMFLIIQSALRRGIRPVIVEVPEYGIEDTASVGLLSWAKRTLYLWLFDSGRVDVIKEYRIALLDRITAAGISDEVTLIDFSNITDDYHSCTELYANASHLNEAGYSQLGGLIARSIEDAHNNAIRLGRISVVPNSCLKWGCFAVAESGSSQ